jgi:hypothetical protein
MTANNKSPVVVVTLFVFATLLNNGATYAFHAADFRGNDWGDSPEEVIAVEGEPDFTEEDPRYPLLGYYVEFEGYKVELRYQFTPDWELASGHYDLENDIDLAPFFVWLDAVSAIYGPATLDDYIFTGIREYEKGIREALSRRDEKTLIEAVVTLKILLSYEWNGDMTGVLLWAFDGGKNTLIIHLGYFSNEYGPILADSLPGGPLEPEYPKGAGEENE